ncbi:MAG: DUF4097 family beta strand repeat-containing protein [Candidatus Tyrphobacter sp.]
MTGSDGPLNLRTSSGDVHLSQARRAIDAQTSSGDIAVEIPSGWSGSHIALTAGSGDVRLNLPANFRGVLSEHSNFGDIRGPSIPPGPARVTISTGFGDISVDRE